MAGLESPGTGAALNRKKVCVVGAGWAGLAAAIGATQGGHQVTVLEASRTLGGRARALAADVTHPVLDGSTTPLDNGQHILIGAYRETLDLMRLVGVEPEDTLLRLPLTLLQPDGSGLRLPDWPQPWNLLAGVLGAKGWSWGDKQSLMTAIRRWQRSHFQCRAAASVADICVGIRPLVMDTFISPLCVSALNTPVQDASGQVFLTVLGDTLKAVVPRIAADSAQNTNGIKHWAGSDILLPKTDLSALFPDAAARWLEAHGTQIRLGARAPAPRWQAGHLTPLSGPHRPHMRFRHSPSTPPRRPKTWAFTWSAGCVRHKSFSSPPSQRSMPMPKDWCYRTPCWRCPAARKRRPNLCLTAANWVDRPDSWPSS